MLFIAAQGCTSAPETPVKEQFEITDSLVKKLIIDTVSPANSRTDLMFSAKITADEERKAEIFPMVSGTVSSVPVRLGDRVGKGQVLATLGSGEMAGFDKEVISSAAELRNAERALKQAQQLFDSGMSSARELEEAKNDLLVKQAEDRRARAILRLNGGSSSGSYTIKSPISGFIIEKNVNANMILRPDNDNALFTVADLSTVWAMVNIYESDISRIREGDEASISLLSYPEQEFKGKIDRIYNQIDNESKVMNARISIPNPGYQLKPGMMSTVKIAAKTGINLPVVNSRGIIFDDNKNYVLLLDASGKPKIQEVEIGRKTADKVYISKGLTAGDRIIASRQVFLFESLKN
ncbi:putative cation efflux-related lipoprotein [Pedobacter sp. BAL39]|nr:putative cation efflux-related lipoprotein [Pedobacter sp. BAL39]